MVSFKARVVLFRTTDSKGPAVYFTADYLLNSAFYKVVIYKLHNGLNVLLWKPYKASLAETGIARTSDSMKAVSKSDSL